MKWLRKKKRIFSSFLMLSALLTTPACVKKKNSTLATRYDSDVERIDLGRGINAATGVIGAPCLIFNPEKDIIRTYADSYDLYIDRYKKPPENANPADPKNRVDPTIQPGDAMPVRVAVRPNQIVWVINYIRDSHDFQRQLEVAGAGKFTNGAFAVSASAKFAQSISFTKSSVYLLIDVRIASSRIKLETKNDTVRIDTAFVPPNGVEGGGKVWTNTCGDEIITEMTLGARRFVLLEIKDASDIQKQDISARFQVKAMTGQGEMGFRQTLSSISTSSAVSVTGLQLGGTLDHLATQMTPDGLIADTEAWIRKVQNEMLYVPISFSSETWANIPSFSKLLHSQEIITQQGKRLQLEQLARPYGKARDQLAFAKYALQKPYMVTDTRGVGASDPGGVKLPGLNSDQRLELQELIDKLENYILLIEKFAADCTLDETKCLDESLIVGLADAPDTLEFVRYKTFVKLKKELEVNKLLAGLKLLPPPELKNHSLCRDLGLTPVYKVCEDKSIPTKYKSAPHKNCGIKTVKTERAARCGVERWKSQHDCGVCGRSWGWNNATSCKSCESSKFGPDVFKECALLDGNGNAIVEEYTTCIDPANGTQEYGQSRHPGCEVESEPRCVIVAEPDGKLRPIREEDYYK
ncbi:MAG: hypothetical protein FJ146_17620 [Deltaproteobacteria bacterium]|nr:hypothetical protein [Deltaproteobacteria bacterium]